MEAKEFMVGNLFDNYGTTCRVRAVDGFKKEIEFEYYPDSSGFIRVAGSDKFPKPIPLTYEIALELGFTYNKHTLVICWQYNGFMHLELMQTNNGWWCILVNRASGQETGRMNFRHIQFVHELQNIYFGLTGTELILK